MKPENTTDLSQVTDKLYHTMLYTSSWSRFKLTTSVVIGIDCIGNCKSNYHTITTTTALVGYKGGVIPYIYSRRRKRKCIASLLMGINDTTFWLKHGRSKRLWIKLLDYYGLNVYKLIQMVSSTYANILKYHIQGMPQQILYYRCLYSN